MIDRQLRFASSAQAVTASAASTDLIDTGAAQDWGPGKTLWFVSHCTVAMTDASSNSTVTVSLESDDAAAFSSATTVATLPVFAALSAAGTVRVMQLPPMTTNERYLRAYYTVANGDLSTGSFDTYITETPPAIGDQYADNITIS